MRDPRVLSHLLQIVDKEEQRLGGRLERGTVGCHRAAGCDDQGSPGGDASVHVALAGVLGGGVMANRHFGVPGLRRGRAARRELRAGPVRTARRDLIGRALAAGLVAALAAVMAITSAVPAVAGAAAGPDDAAIAARVKPGKLATLVLSPAMATIAPGGTQAYTAQGFDASGGSLGDVTSQATFTISAGGSCTGPVCTATASGAHTVTGAIKKVRGTATLTVVQADLAASQTVSNAAPFDYAPVTFTTTVTNTSSTTPSAGVTAAVNVPGGLRSPTVTLSTGSYDAGTWTIGSVGPGATATLTINADAAAVSDGPQTVTATVSAATFDPNSANNTASATETSQPPPIEAVIIPEGSSVSLVDVCAPPDVNFTWRVSVSNAANPAAPPSSVGNLSYVWAVFCNSPFCPAPVNGIRDPFVTFTNAGFVLGERYTMVVVVTPDPLTDHRVAVATDIPILTTCFV